MKDLSDQALEQAKAELKESHITEKVVKRATEIHQQLQDEAQQDAFIDKLTADIEHLCEKANRKDYEPTLHEKQQFERIHAIVTNMAAWF